MKKHPLKALDLERLNKAEQTLKQVFGTDWIKKWLETEPLGDPAAPFGDEEREGYHPLRLHWKKTGLESRIRITVLGEDLQTLIANGVDLDMKVDELKHIKGFAAANFEIHIASLLVDEGANVQFISAKHGKTPEMSVDYKGTKFHVECKKKEPRGSKEKLIDCMFRRIMDHSLNVMKYEKINMRIDLTFKNIPSTNDLVLIESAITDIIVRKLKGTVQVKEIAEISSDILFPYNLFIPYIPSHKAMSDGGWLGTWVAQSNLKPTPIEGIMDITEMDSHSLASLKFRNLCVVRYKSPAITLPRIDSIANTLESPETLDKFKDYHPGVIFLEMDVTADTHARDFELLMGRIRAMLETDKFSQVWAVIIFASLFHTEKKIAGFQTLIATAFNSGAKIPEHVRDLLVLS